LPVLYTFPYPDDLSGYFHTGHKREVRSVLVLASDEKCIGEVDAAGMNPDCYLSQPGSWLCDLSQPKVFWLAPPVT
jgi:hypothetical protein